MQLANALSALRLLLAPALLLLAWQGAARAFTGVLVVSLLTDALDGRVARWLGQSSRLGAVLDSAADLATYTVVPLCAVWLKPDLVQRERVAFWLTLACYLVPVLAGFARFRRLTSYHTHSARLAGCLIGAGALALFAVDTTLVWRAGLPVLVLAALENLAITATLPAWQPAVPTLGRALALRRTAAGDAAGAAPVR
jgi:CDP-diacylglycerol--glycerol-3-phosphate 3-phosphatidyltransferase